MVAATFRQPNPLMIMYTAKTASSGSATERTQSAMPSSSPTATHLAQRRTRTIPQQQRRAQGEQKQEWDVPHDQVLELDLEPVIKHRDRRQRGEPGRGAEAVPGQRVHHDRDRQAHEMLQDCYEGVTMKRLGGS